MMTEFKKLKRTHFYWISMIAVAMAPFLLFFFYWIGGISFSYWDFNKSNLFLLSSLHNKITFPLIVIILAQIDGGIKGLKTLDFLPRTRNQFIVAKLLFSFLWMLVLIIFSILWHLGLGSLIYSPGEIFKVIMKSMGDYGLVLLFAISVQCLSLLIYYLLDNYSYTLITLLASLVIGYGLQLYKDFSYLPSYLTKYFVLKADMDINMFYHLMSMVMVIIFSMIGLQTIVRKLDRNR